MTHSTDEPLTPCHTPGPWNYDTHFIVAADPSGVHRDIYIAEIAHEDDDGRIASTDQQDANRRLIAAAPDLFELAQQIILANDSDEGVPVDLYFAALRIAGWITSSKGGSQ